MDVQAVIPRVERMNNVCKGYYNEDGDWYCSACEAELPEECYILPPEEGSEYSSNHDMTPDQKLDDPIRGQAADINKKIE